MTESGFTDDEKRRYKYSVVSKFRDDVEVTLIRAAASDEAVVHAARVSTLGEVIASADSTDSPVPNELLINFLMRERHGSPFEHALFTFFVKAPIFVWREHMRHRIASYNEESGRYRVLAPEFYIPSRDRHLLQVGKAGAYKFHEGTDEQHALLNKALREQSIAAYCAYDEMVKAGIAREVARMVLPVNIYSSAYVTMNARALMNFLSLRRRSDDSRYPSYPQREIEMVAEQYEDEFARLMPATHTAFVKHGRVAP